MSDSLWPHALYTPWNFPGQNTRVDSLSLLQRIFQTQGSNPGLLRYRQIFYQLSYKGSQHLEWVAYPFSSGSSWPRNQTGVSYIAGGFFTNWAMREALMILLPFSLLFWVYFIFLFYILPREVPLAFVVKLVWWCWILLTFSCLESFWFLHQIWRRVLLGGVFLVVSSSLSSLEINHAIPFWLVEFLLRNQLIAWWEFPCMLFVVFSLLLLIFYLCL